MTHDALTTAKDKMGKTLAVMQRDFASIRAGRANPQVLDRVMVDYYGTATPIQQMGTVSTPEARVFLIMC